MTGIGTTQLISNLTGQDVHNLRLTRTATGMSSTSAAFVWDPTTRFILKREETDKQNDENLTFLFEYRALLNSRVQTLITQLSNALASDLDVAMNASNAQWANTKPAMNGNSTNTTQDPGAARAAHNYMISWFDTVAASGPGNLVPSTNVVPGPSDLYGAQYSDSVGPAAIIARGSASIVTAQSGLIDRLDISGLYSGNPNFNYINNDTEGAGRDNQLNDSFAGPLGAAALVAGSKNLVEKVLFDALSSIEYKSVLSSGLFKNIVVAASSSLPTGAQLQASLNINYNGAQDGGSVLISIDKMTAFYHS